jgi:transposase
MTTAISHPIRQEIVERHQRGDSLSQIATALNLSYWTVRQLWRQYRDQGMAGLSCQYARCGRRGLRHEGRWYRASVWLKRHHPSWGAGLIRVLLQERYGSALPHVRTLQRWFTRAGVARPHRRGHRSVSPPFERASQVHQVWQLDATSHLRLEDGTGVSWISVTDEYSGALLDSVVFSPVPI